MGVLLSIVVAAPIFAQDSLVVEDFTSVDARPGFELSHEQAHSGDTSAKWADMVATPQVTCTEIPHDWSGYSHFTFWVYNEVELPARFMCIVSSENPDTDGPDYWAVGVPLSFTGWRRFGIPIVEGSGTRAPRGWDQVDSIMFTASGWGNEPRADAVVYIDDFQLTNEYAGPGPLLSDADFFGDLRDDIPQLAATREAAAAGDYAKAKVEYLAYMRSRTKPVWRFDWHNWDQERKAEYDTTRADRAVSHTFSSFGREVDLGPDINWKTNGFDPKEPAYTPEWTYNLNRFGAWIDLGRAYWATGDEKYAQEWVAQMLDWTADELSPVLGSPNTAPTWRTIEQGIRTAGAWMDAYHYFLGSPSLTPDAHCTFVKSFVEHAQQLRRMTVDYPEHGGNWVTMECNGLAHVGVMFPEFKASEDWRNVAYGRLMQELDRQVYPDGAQMELTGGYHQVALRNFKTALDPLLRNDLPAPAGYLEKLERMYRYDLECMMPDGTLPPLNDAGNTNVLGYLKEAYELYGNEEYLWGATRGAEGKPVDFTSIRFPWAGQCVMRSGWKPDDAYLMFEVGPFGTGHQHEDKLGLYLYADGRTLLTEAGTYTYDHSKWRRYALGTASHNTIMVDGLHQNRRSQRETYQAMEPLTGDWLTTEAFDWCTGRYDEGYGPDRDRSITHERTVIFVRPDYYVVLDRLLGEGEHTYSNLFHLDADNADLDEATLAVTTTQPDAANLTLIPVERDGLTVRVVKGQEDPVQGWVPRDRHRAIPTPIYEKTSVPPVVFATLLVPIAQGEASDASAELLDTGLPGEEVIAIRVTRGDRVDTILYAFEGPRAMNAGGIEAQARLAIVRTGEGGTTASAMEGQVLQATP